MDYIVNFSAFCLPLALFSFWGILGFATLSLLRTQRNTLQNVLLAPTIGFAVTLLPIFWLNRLGFPIAHFAAILMVSLYALSTIILWQRKPLFPLKRYLPFAGIFILAMFVTGSPLLIFGFDWVSYSNGDMANYCLAAQRFLNHGYFEIPDVDDLIQGKDYSLFYWFMHVPGVTRSGVDITLAWVSGITHLNPLKIFMPVILTYHLLLTQCHRRPNLYRTTKDQSCHCRLLTAYIFSAYYSWDIIPTHRASSRFELTKAVIISLFQPFNVHKNSIPCRKASLIAIAGSSLLVTYPEMIPFLVIPFILYFAYQYFQGWRVNRSFFLSLGLASVLTLLFLNIHLFAVYEFLLFQTKFGVTSVSSQLVVFPYYLLPSGWANLWGLIPIAGAAREPRMSLSIVIGVIFSLTVIYLSARSILRKSQIVTPAIVTLMMTCLWVALFKQHSGFGLFKLAMFMQPFILSVITVSLFELVKSHRVKITVIAILILASLPSINYYIDRSKGMSPGSFSEVPYASSTKVNNEFALLISGMSKNTLLFSNDFNLSLIKFLMVQSSQYQFYPLTSLAHFEGFFGVAKEDRTDWMSKVHEVFFYSKEARQIADKYLANATTMRRFNIDDSNSSNMEFLEPNLSQIQRDNSANSMLLMDTSLRSVINSRLFKDTSGHNFILEKQKDAKNQLVFINSSLGRIYYDTYHYKNKNISLFNIERDGIYAKKIMQSVGQYLLFRVFNPSPKFRMVVSLTNTFNGDGKNEVPHIKVIGRTHALFPSMGRGSARIFSQPIAPQIINGGSYIAADMGAGVISFSVNIQD